MEIQTKYNIGNTVWLINRSDFKLEEFEISRIYISYRKEDVPPNGIYRAAHIEYAVTDGINDAEKHIINEDDEGTKWWKTRDDAIAYITGKLVPLGDRHSMVQKTRECCKDDTERMVSKFQKLPGIKKKSEIEDAFEKFFSDDSDDVPLRSVERARQARKLREEGRRLASNAVNQELNKAANDLFGNDFG